MSKLRIARIKRWFMNLFVNIIVHDVCKICKNPNRDGDFCLEKCTWEEAEKFPSGLEVKEPLRRLL